MVTGGDTQANQDANKRKIRIVDGVAQKYLAQA
jgi:hypothetical protein